MESKPSRNETPNALNIPVSQLTVGNMIMVEDTVHQVLCIEASGREYFTENRLVCQRGLDYTLTLRNFFGEKKVATYAREASFQMIFIDVFKKDEHPERAHAKTAQFTHTPIAIRATTTSAQAPTFRDLMSRRRALNALLHQLNNDVKTLSASRWHNQGCALGGLGTGMQCSLVELEPCWCGIDAAEEKKLMPSLYEEPTKTIKVKLTYFTPTGKYYSEGNYMTEKTAHWAIVEEVKYMLVSGNNPGLVANAVLTSGFVTHIDVQDELLSVPHVLTYQMLIEYNLKGVQPVAKLGDQVELFSPLPAQDAASVDAAKPQEADPDAERSGLGGYNWGAVGKNP